MKYRLRTITPVHIGTGEEFSPFDYALTEERFGPYCLDRLLAERPERAAALEDAVATAPEQFSLNGFLQPEELADEGKWRYRGRLAPGVGRLLQEQLRRGRADVAEAIKTPADRLYLPGSSLKGALRTALAYSYLKGHPQELQRLESSDWPRMGTAVEELFSGRIKGPQGDLLKALWVSDSTTIAPEMSLQVEAAKTVSLGSRNLSKPWWTFLETISAGTELEAELQLQEGLIGEPKILERLGWERWEGLDEEAIFSSCNDFSRDLAAHELNFFRTHDRDEAFAELITFYETLLNRLEGAEERCILRLGKGSGWTGLTIGLLLLNDPQFPLEKFRNRLKLGRLGSKLFPKSRLLLSEPYGNEVRFRQPLGWIELRREEGR